MDKSDMSRAEKKELRNEVKEICTFKATGGIYLSVGAIIIVITTYLYL
jgi:hypothetical protein